nr:LysR substrate-binding domain-containing protein [Enterovibrio nigricans]
MPLSTHDEDAELIIRERLLLVGSPELMKGVDNIDALLTLNAISHITRPQIWNQFWHDKGISPDTPQYGVGFEHFYMAFEAVRHCEGVALIPEFLVQKYVKKTVVVNPVSMAYDSPYGYFLFSHGYKRRLGPVKQVIDWLRREVIRGVRSPI